MVQSKLEILISEDRLQKRISEIANQINEEFKGKSITLICILKGGVMFMTEIAKRLTLDIEIDFMDISSYGSSAVSGELNILKDLENSIEGKDVLLIEDIIDTGKTLNFLIKYLKSKRLKSLKICTLLDKPSRRIIDVKVDYIGFQIPDEFIVGYGLDFNQKYRNLPYIAIYKPLE